MGNTSEENLVELLTLRKLVNANGTICYFNKDDRLHRIHGPAIICTNGSVEWWVEGNLHRINEPAVIWPSGYKEWWEYGKRLKRELSGTAESS